MTATLDVAVVGAGVTGLTAAALAARAGARVQVVAPAAALACAAPRGATELRTFALTPASRRILEHIGAWTALDPARLGPFEAMEVWDARSCGRIRFTAPTPGAGPLGWLVEEAALRAALFGVLAAQGVTLRAGTARAAQGHAPVMLELVSGMSCAARLVIAADGVESALRAAAGMTWHHHPYGQRAVVANLLMSRPHEAVARQRFLPGGPLALLPLADPCAVALVWTLPEADAVALEQADDAAFGHALEQASAQVLGSVREITPRAGFALARGRAARLVADGLVLVGDAAHLVHPLAGQGLNLGLLDCAALFECLGPVTSSGWPRATALRRYERWRQSEALDMTVATDGLHRLFRRDEAVLRWLRGAGFRLTDVLTPVKRWCTRRAMGETGDLPRCARPADGALTQP